MITLSDYKTHLQSKGDHLGEIRKNRADMIMNATFKGDIGYRKVYILDKDDGWKFVDAKFSRHAVSSISKDAVDSYLQFRPKEHYPIGTYVFIPDDTKYDLTVSPLPEPVDPKSGDPVCDPYAEPEAFEYDINGEDPLWDYAHHLWIIVNRTEDRQFVQYLVLKCNWKFKWLVGHGDTKQIYSCWGCVRDSASYTSGVWLDYYVTGLDNITKAWIPDTYNVYDLKYGLFDTRTIHHQIRMMITHNAINPKCYMVSKVDDTTPPGIIKVTYKQDDYNPKRDNPALMICDYFDDSGDIMVEEPVGSNDPCKTSTIYYMVVNRDGELEVSSPQPTLELGATYYWMAEFSDPEVEVQWRIRLIDDDESYTEKERLELERLMVMRDVDDRTISVRPGKSLRLKGLKYQLIASDINGDFESKVELEVIS